MKSNFRNGKEKGMGADRNPEVKAVVGGPKAKAFSVSPNPVDLRRSIYAIVKADYDKLVEKFGKEKSITILKNMLTPTYIGKFEPKTREVEKAVKKCVENLIVQVSKEIIEDKSKTIDLTGKSIGTLRSDLEQLKKAKAVSKGTILSRKAAELIAKYDKELKVREAEMKEEVGYFETVKAQTQGFKYLVADPTVKQSEFGNSNAKKFASFAQYDRFQMLRNLVIANMSKDSEDEHAAIKKVLTDVEEKRRILRPADRKILISRSEVIEKEKAEDLDR